MAEDTEADRAAPTAADGDEPYPELVLAGNLPEGATLVTPTVNQAIVLCMREIGAVAKNRQNTTQKYNFRGIDDFLNACHHVMAKHGLTIVPAAMDHDLVARERVTNDGKPGYSMHVINKVRWEAEGPAGDKKYFVTVGEAADTADKATNKSISAAEKYMLITVFKIPTEDIAEGDSEHPDTGGSTTSTGSTGAKGSKGAKGAKGEEDPTKPTQPMMAKITLQLEEIIGKTNVDEIKGVLKAITGRVDRRSHLTRAEAHKVIDTLEKIKSGEISRVKAADDTSWILYKTGEEPFETPPAPEPGGGGSAYGE